MVVRRDEWEAILFDGLFQEAIAQKAKNVVRRLVAMLEHIDPKFLGFTKTSHTFLFFIGLRIV